MGLLNKPCSNSIVKVKEANGINGILGIYLSSETLCSKSVSNSLGLEGNLLVSLVDLNPIDL